MWHNYLLKAAGAVAIGIALYHGFVGDAAITALEVNPAEQIEFLRSTFQLGTMGWIAGGVLLMAAGGFASQQARNWIVGVFGFIYGFPAVGAFLMTGGRFDISWVGLGLAVVLAIAGRKIPKAAV